MNCSPGLHCLKKKIAHYTFFFQNLKYQKRRGFLYAIPSLFSKITHIPDMCLLAYLARVVLPDPGAPLSNTNNCPSNWSLFLGGRVHDSGTVAEGFKGACLIGP